MYHFGSSGLSCYVALFVFTLPPTPYDIGNLLLLYLWFSNRSLLLYSLCGFHHWLSLQRVSPLRNSHFQAQDVRRHSNIRVHHLVSIPAYADWHLQGCYMGNYSHSISSDFSPFFLWVPSEGGICDHQMLYSNVWTTCPKTLLGSNFKAVEKGRRPFGMLQICSSVFCVRSYQMFICVQCIYIIYI